MSDRPGSFAGKLGASVLVAVCAVLGLVGLILPVIPGLLLLGVAAVVAARHFPWVGTRLRSHRTLGKHFRRADQLDGLTLAQKARLFGWYSLKMIGEGLTAIATVVARLGGAPK